MRSIHAMVACPLAFAFTAVVDHLGVLDTSTSLLPSSFLSPPQNRPNQHHIAECNMAHKIIVRTEKGKASSLRRETKIVFTLEPQQATQLYSPVARGLDDDVFHDSDEMGEYSWTPTFAFRQYHTSPLNGRESCCDNGPSWEIRPGQSRTITSISGQGVRCHPPRPFRGGSSARETSVVLVNDTGSTRDIALQINEGDGVFWSVAAFHSLEEGEKCVASSGLVLRCYVVWGEGSHDDDILTPERRSVPLFSTPVECKAILGVSTWTLSQDQNGLIRLVNDRNPTLGAPHCVTTEDEAHPASMPGHLPDPAPSISELAQSFDNIKDQLATVLVSLNAVTQRVAAVEKAAASNQTELSVARQSLLNIRNKLDRVDSAGTGVQAKSAGLEISLARTEDRVALVENSIAIAHADLASGKKAMLDLGNQLSAFLAGGAAPGIPEPDHRLPAVEARVEALVESVGAIREDVSTMQKSCVATDTRLSSIDSTLHDHRKLILDQVDSQGPGVETKPNAKSPPLGMRTRTTAGLVLSQAGDLSDVQSSLHSLRNKVADLDGRVPALEARGDKLARGFNQTLENLTSVNRYLQTAQRRISGLESRVPVLEEKAHVLSDSLAITEEQLIGLGPRVTGVELKMETLSVSFAEARKHGTGNWSPYNSAGCSPAVFPAQEPGLSASGVEAPPWLTLPQPLDEKLTRLSRPANVE